MSSKRELIGAADPNAPMAIPLSPAVRWGDLLFVSGHAAVDPKTLKIVEGDFETQARHTLDQIEDVLRRAGSGLDQVLRLECFLKNASDFSTWNRVYAERFADVRPARTTVVCDFVIPAMLIEIQVTAGIPARS
jgi:2-iminobutanoate/2-iminopropanoate deaminase